MSTFFISDLHFGHKNCLAFDNRKFVSIEDHDEALIERWNSVVEDHDDVWVLGDISWHSPTKTIEIFKRLNGTKHLCIGNHDTKLLRSREVRNLFAEIVDYKELSIGTDRGIVLCHYPIPCFKNHYYGWIHLYGHVHNSFEWNIMEQVKYEMSALYDKPCRMFNVGCMIPGMDFMPKTIEEILERFETNNTNV